MSCTAFIKGMNRKRSERTRRMQHPWNIEKTGRRDWQHVRPTQMQAVMLHDVQTLLLRYKSERRSFVYGLLKERYGVEVKTQRFTKVGGVGTAIWLPKFRTYRVQVGASMITTKRHCYMYAPCIEF